MTTTDTIQPAKRTRKMAREPQREVSVIPEQVAAMVPAVPTEKVKSKAALVLEMLQRADGATLDELTAATGWLRHTMRAALTGVRKKGHALTSEKLGGLRRYRIAAGADAGAGQ